MCREISWKISALQYRTYTEEICRASRSQRKNRRISAAARGASFSAAALPMDCINASAVSAPAAGAFASPADTVISLSVK